MGQIYYKRRNRCKFKFSCSVCKETFDSQHYESHCSSCLNLNPRLQCIWCDGHFSWPVNKKTKNTDHLLDCWEYFKKRKATAAAAAAAATTTTTVVENDSSGVVVVVVDDDDDANAMLDDSSPMIEGGNMFGRPRVLENEPGAYNNNDQLCFPIQLFSDDETKRVFRDENLNDAVECVRLYLKGGYEFNHCMVRAVVFKNFVEAMERDGNARILPFSCWCDGLEKDDSRVTDLHRHHRHYIIIYPLDADGNKKFHENVWSKIKMDEGEQRPFPYFKCVVRKPIKSTMHLINTIGYLSKTKSRCDGTLEERTTGDFKDKHFCIFAPLPANYRLPLAMQWDGGILELIKQMYKFKSPKLFWGAPSLRKMNGLWHVAIEDLPEIRKGLVLALKKKFKLVFFDDEEEEERSDRAADDRVVFFHLTGGKRLCVVIDESLEDLIDEESWVRVQAAGGCNLFYDVVGKVMWKIEPYLQKCLDVGEEAERRCRLDFEAKEARYERVVEEKEAELASLRVKKCEEEEEESSRIKKKYEEEMVGLKIKYEEELADLKEKEMEQQRIIDDQREAGVKSKKRIRTLRSELERLKRRKLEMHVERLEMVVEKMKKEQRESDMKMKQMQKEHDESVMKMKKMQERFEKFERQRT